MKRNSLRHALSMGILEILASVVLTFVIHYGIGLDKLWHITFSLIVALSIVKIVRYEINKKGMFK